ncbi:serine/threonine protein kinase [Xylaria cf. heliscus]|nr:serine/threonine protein kinase [Xylaria cf. heliscus]
MSNRRPKPGPGSTHEQIQTVLSKANFHNLQNLACLSRTAHDKKIDLDLLCTINPSSFTYGSNIVVLEVSFSDQVYWIAKIQYISIDKSKATENAMDLLSEIATMRVIRDRTSIPVPQVFTYDVHLSNPVGYPYILMEYIDGWVLGGPLASQVPSSHLPKVAKQLAEPPKIIPLSLNDIPGTKPIRRTSLDWFYTYRQENNRYWRTACWVLKTAVPHIIIEAQVHCPFPFCHVDLHYGNLLFGDDYNLKAVVDWSRAQTVPLERLVISPEIIPFPGGSDEQNKKFLNLKSLIHEHIRHLEQKELTDNKLLSIPLSNVFRSKRAEITYWCTYSFPHRALWDGQLVARLLYGEDILWEQLVRVYGEADIS